MAHGNATFRHHVFQVAAADAVLAVPAHAQQDQSRRKVQPPEYGIHVLSLLSHPLQVILG